MKKTILAQKNTYSGPAAHHKSRKCVECPTLNFHGESCSFPEFSRDPYANFTASSKKSRALTSAGKLFPGPFPSLAAPPNSQPQQASGFTCSTTVRKYYIIIPIDDNILGCYAIFETVSGGFRIGICQTRSSGKFHSTLISRARIKFSYPWR